LIESLACVRYDQSVSNNTESFIMNTIAIKNMSTIKRIQAMEAIWDSLIYDQSDIKSPEWHIEVLMEREGKIKDNQVEVVSIKD